MEKEVGLARDDAHAFGKSETAETTVVLAPECRRRGWSNLDGAGHGESKVHTQKGISEIRNWINVRPERRGAELEAGSQRSKSESGAQRNCQRPGSLRLTLGV